MMAADVVFVLPGRDELELDRIRALDVDRDWRFFDHSIAAWIVQSYLLLREMGQSVELSGAFSKSGVNVVHVSQVSRQARPRGCYVMAVRADYPRCRWAQLHLVQNQTQVDAGSIWLPHWPQPGLIQRHPARGHSIQRVGYFGRSTNHYSRVFHRASGYFRVRSGMQHICDRLGLDLVERGPERWNDFSDVDVVLGLRAFSDQTFDTKPATKLCTAWLAGAVFVGGADSAYKQVGTPGRNYLLATTQTACQGALEDLLSGKVGFRTMVASGSAAVPLYTRASVADRWVVAINRTLRSGWA